MNILLHDYGGYAFSLQLAAYLARRGHRVLYVHGGSTQVVQRFHGGEGTPGLDVEGMRLSAPFAKYSFARRWMQEQEYARRLRRRIMADKPDVVVSANAPLDAQRLAFRAARRSGARFVYWWQDVVSLAMREQLARKYGAPGRLAGAWYQAMEARLLRGSDQVIAISEDFLPMGEAWGVRRGKMTVLDNWAALDEIPCVPKDNPWSRAAGLQDRFVFLYSGVLGIKHDPSVVASLAEHFRDRPEVRIAVISEGPGADWLGERKREAGLDNLLVLPFQPAEEYPRVLAAADVLVSVLRASAGSYSVPSKVLTYLCAARPVLLMAPLENQAARLVLEQGAGLAVPPQDEDGFCRSARKLYESAGLRAACGHNGRAYAEAAFDIHRIGGRFLDCIEGAGSVPVGGVPQEKPLAAM